MEYGLLVLLLNTQTPQQPIQIKTDYSNILMVKPPLDLLKKPEVEKPKEPTLEEKIAQNINKCTDNQWIRADNAECLDKPVYSPVPNISKNTPTYSNTYSYGYCTYGVASWVSIPNNWGDAHQWANSASNAGYVVNTFPEVGSIATTTRGKLGHVALVIGIDENKILIKEMNSEGWNIVSQRWASISEFMYIHL